MVSLEQLWIPVVLSAVLVFVMSSLIHMVFKWHNSEYHGFANEEEVRKVVRAANAAPGQYILPYCPDHKELMKPEVQQKFIDGPVAFVNVMKPGPTKMGPMLGQWFALNLVIAIVVGYLACKTLPIGLGFLAVAREVSLVTFLAYAGGSISHAIWMGKPKSAAAKEILDAFLYGLVTAIAFGWLWPR
jgi:hypothetical protein